MRHGSELVDEAVEEIHDKCKTNGAHGLDGKNVKYHALGIYWAKRHLRALVGLHPRVQHGSLFGRDHAAMERRQEVEQCFGEQLDTIDTREVDGKGSGKGGTSVECLAHTREQ